MSRKKKRGPSGRSGRSESSEYRQRRREFAAYAANRHLRAYMVDEDHRHIANAWFAYRESGLPPDKGMLKAIDMLCREVLKDKNAKVRLRNSLRNAELERIVTAFRVEKKRIRDELKRMERDPEKANSDELKEQKKLLANWNDLYPYLARDHGISENNLKQIMRNLRRSARV